MVFSDASPERVISRIYPFPCEMQTHKVERVAGRCVDIKEEDIFELSMHLRSGIKISSIVQQPTI